LEEALEAAIPQWWQMVELKNRNIPYQPFQEWQEEASKVLDSANDVIKSENVYNINEAVNKVNSTH